MFEIKTVFFVAVLLLAAAGFYAYQVKSETKVGQHNEIKSESPCEKDYKKYCMKFYVVDEDIVACNCTWLKGGRRCEKYMWWT